MSNQIITQYRDTAKSEEWKKSHAEHTFEDVCRLNKIIGYEKYRQVVR